MNDKELLELAANAAGLCFTWRPYGGYISGADGSIPWNPLTDDSDALRLAVSLGLVITCTPSAKTSWAGIHCYDFAEDHGDDPYAATRRAIVRAAAMIGNAT